MPMDINERYRGWRFNSHSAQFDRNASLVLVGSRGVGKSSLAVLTAMALNRRFIDLIVTMETLCGESCETVRTKYGHRAFCQKEAEILSSLLAKCPTNCVIATTSSSVEEPVKSVLLKYKTQLPIVNILRSPDDVNEYLKRYEDHQELMKLASVRQDLYRYCSDFEFMNNGTRYQDRVNYPLGLKNSGREFLQFLDRIYGHAISFHPNAYSHDLILPYTDVTGVDLENVAIGTSTAHIRVDLMAVWAIANDVDVMLHISCQVGYLKRAMPRLPLVYGLGQSISSGIQRLYALLISHAFKLAVEFVSLDCELLEDSTIRQLMSSRRNTKVIGCYSTNTWNSIKLESLVRRGHELGCDLVRVNSFALELNDNYLLMNALQDLKARGNVDMSKVIAYNNGPLGKFSRCFNHLLTPVSHPSFWHDPNSFFAPDCSLDDPEFQGSDGVHLSVKEANELLKNLYISPQAELFYFGSGKNYWRDVLQKSVDLMGLPCYFHQHPIQGRNSFREALSSPQFGGAFISELHKMDILDEVPSCSEDCKMIGAANLVVASRDSNSLRINALTAHNTDWRGLYSTVSHHLPTKNSICGSTSAVVIGACGLGRAAVFALMHVGAKNIFVYDKDIEKAKRVVSHFHGATDKLSTFGAQAWNIEQASNAVLSMRYITRKGDLRKPDQHRPKNYGTISFETDDSGPSLNLVEHLDSDWIAGKVSQPTLVINCSDSTDLALHPSWFGNGNGGVFVDMGAGSIKLAEQLEGLPKEGTNGWIVLDKTEVWMQVADANLELLTGKRSSMAVLREYTRAV